MSPVLKSAAVGAAALPVEVADAFLGAMTAVLLFYSLKKRRKQEGGDASRQQTGGRAEKEWGGRREWRK